MIEAKDVAVLPVHNLLQEYVNATPEQRTPESLAKALQAIEGKGPVRVLRHSDRRVLEIHKQTGKKLIVSDVTSLALSREAKIDSFFLQSLGLPMKPLSQQEQDYVYVR